MRYFVSCAAIPSYRLLSLLGWCIAFVTTGTVGCFPMVNVKIESEVTANEGKPFYIVAREVAEADQVHWDQYDDIAQEVFIFSGKSDAGKKTSRVLGKELVIPGEVSEFKFRKPEDESKAVGIYVLFTYPGRKWSFPLRYPLPSEIQFTVGVNEIEGSIIVSGGS